jgi:hypothetical protein
LNYPTRAGNEKNWEISSNGRLERGKFL